MGNGSPILYGLWGLAGLLLVYPVFVSLLTIPAIQQQAIYLNAFKMTWNQALDCPEQWGFLPNQVIPFWLSTVDGEKLLAWHIVPLGLYLKHEQRLLEEPSGISADIEKSLGYSLLKNDPQAELVLYFHGAAGTLGSGYRPPSYHAISAGSLHNRHIIAVDYRGFGDSSGKPSEAGLFIDAMTVVDFAMRTLSIPPSRIVLFGQSLGTAVSIAVAQHLASQSPPIIFAGMVLVAPFLNVETLTATYRIAGTIPLLDPLARFPRLMTYLNSFIKSKWDSGNKLMELIRTVDNLDDVNARYCISLIHGQDDYDIPFKHSEMLFEHAVNATVRDIDSAVNVARNVEDSRKTYAAGGYSLHRISTRGYISLDILKYGLHDKIMGYPIVSRGIARAFSGIE